MLFEALGRLLPIEVAMAISSVPITATLAILLSPRQRKSSLPFLAGWVLGIALVVVVFTLGAVGIPERTSARPQVVIGIGLIVVGVALEVLAAVLWRRWKTRPASSDTPRWLRAVGAIRPWEAFGLAFVMNLRPKAILLSAAAGLSLRTERVTFGEAAIALAVFTVVAASTVAVPVLYAWIAPGKAEPRLITARDWIAKNSRIVTLLILVMIGVVIIGSGLTRL
jgi:hypothetical protein